MMFSRICFAFALVALAAPAGAEPPQRVATVNAGANQKGQKQTASHAGKQGKCKQKRCPKAMRAVPSHP